MSNALSLFLSPVQEWFQQTLGEPTPAQSQGWPHIADRKHTLILAPTGSGKTLASFLACLDHLWRQPSPRKSVHVLYVSPLKALNNDIYRNLQVPLEGVAETASRMNVELPKLEAGVRTGDTDSKERQQLVRKPPHVLITTPESLHLMLTSKARETLRHLSFCIIDEIHSLCPNKRGVFLSILLERLEAIQECDSFTRIGLSATQRPLDEVASYLGGGSRPVEIVDAGLRKDLDLKVINPVEQFGPLPEKSIWPSIYQLLGDQIRAHTSTLVFANNRRSVERITSFLNEEEEIARAHHGSVALERRQEIESALKEGKIPAVVSTASLEMGIDMGAVDLVCQVESPGNVARSLQRVGRAGHLVGQKSKGRLIPKTPSDLLEQAVLAREMAQGNVESITVPTNCLDVLAQQVVAMTAMDAWHPEELWKLIRRAYPYRELSMEAFEGVLEMVTGRYRFGEEGMPARTIQSLQPRISWDRVNQRLLSLPGTQQISLINGGTIPDTGQYLATTPNGTRIGELDEEFIYERRVGDTFLLGTSAWRIVEIESDRVIVAPAEGAPAMIPFWRGEGLGRSHDLGLAMGAFLRELQTRIFHDDCLEWLQQEHFLDRSAARSLLNHVRRQLDGTGQLPTDRRLILEASRDQLGDWQVVLLSPLGMRLHFALRLALERRLQQRLGYRPQCLHHDDGLMIRLTDCEDPPLDLFSGLIPDNVESLILNELAESALFALRFRQNAARAMLMPRGKPGQRAPLWLQRLQGRDLLQVVKQHSDFPVVVETYRECLQDHLDVPRLRQLLNDIQNGEVEVVEQRREIPSPFAANLVFAFTMTGMYQYDDVEKSQSSNASLDQSLLEQLIQPQEPLLDPRVVQKLDHRLRNVGQPPRTVAEMSEWLRKLGDVKPSELEGPMEAFLDQLESEGVAQKMDLPAGEEPTRWVLTEEVEVYCAAFGQSADAQSAAERILSRYLETHALVGLNDILNRYPFERGWAERQLEQWSQSGRLSRVEMENVEQWTLPENLEQIQRGSLGRLRQEVVTCSAPQFFDYVLRWQRAHSETRGVGSVGLSEVLNCLQGLALPTDLWEKHILSIRTANYESRWLEEWVSTGRGAWVCNGESVAFFEREHLIESPPPQNDASSDSPRTDQVLECLSQCGACFVTDVAQWTELSPSQVRESLWGLTRQGLVSNDQFDVMRRGPEPVSVGTSDRALLRRSMRRVVNQRPEGRWSLLGWRRGLSTEERAIVMANRLLNRYGVATRDLAILDSSMPAWRLLYEVLSQMELSGEVRRGYFVEGLSGAQFALPEAVEMLQGCHLPSTSSASVTLLSSLDPANLYGSSAPFDIPLLDDGTRSFTRRKSNWIIVRAGRPVLLIEQQGKNVTALPTSSRQERIEAIKCLPNLCQASDGLRHRVTVEQWNGEPVTRTEGRELLEEVGFVRDYQSMTLYAVWK